MLTLIQLRSKHQNSITMYTLEGKITEAESLAALHQMNDKSPGPEGFTTELYSL